MDPIFDFSAAPHLPLSLRGDAQTPTRPENLLIALTDAAQTQSAVRVLERNGEIYIDFANAA